MTNEIIEKLLPKVKSVCPPDLELSVKEFPLSSTRVLYLFIIKYDKEFDDVDEWAICEVYKLFHTIYRLAENEKLNGKVRFLFCNRNDFVLYTPVNTSVLYQFDGLIYQECFGYEYCLHLVGKVYDTNELIKYLINQRITSIITPFSQLIILKFSIATIFYL